jgi:hypothetical protein
MCLVVTGAHARLVAWLRRVTLLLVACLSLSLRAEEKFDTLTVGANTYSNVTVINKNSSHVFITHAKGFASFRVKELEPELQTGLGYELKEEPKPQSANPLAKLTEDPEIARMQEHWTKEANLALAKADPAVLAGIGAGIVLAHMFFSLCCFLICRKAGYDPGIWVWIPVAQFFSLFRAAKMSGWNFLLMLIPLIGVIPMIILCFKICTARRKSPALGILLLLPISAPLVFLYLAFADSLESEQGGVVKLQFS